MWFERKITITLACIIIECLLSLIPTIFMIYMFFMMHEMDEIFYTLLIVPYFMLLTNFVLSIITLISQIFIKTKYCISKDCLVIKSDEQIDKISYDEIMGITYDFGNLTKFNTEPSQLVLFDKEYKQLLSINNPSVIMVHILKKKCKHTKVSYYHNKRFLFLLINVIVLFISILSKLFF